MIDRTTTPRLAALACFLLVITPLMAESDPESLALTSTMDETSGGEANEIHDGADSTRDSLHWLEVEPAEMPLKSGVDCVNLQYCRGDVRELISFTITQHGQIRLVVKSQIMKQNMLDYGCEESWSLWMHDGGNRDIMLSQLTVAEALGNDVFMIYGKHSTHCDLHYIYRKGSAP